MCEACGYGDSGAVPGAVNERMLARNHRAAEHNREQFHEHGVAAVNLMGSPGSGKTALIEATALAFGGDEQLGALAGALATDNDLRRIRAAGIPAESINTSSASHLDAEMVHAGLHHLPWRDLDYLFIENVGNLVCPAFYDLGQDTNIVALSITDGNDTPVKYPAIFGKADLVVITKIDLLNHLPDVSLDEIERNLSLVMPKPAMLLVSSATGIGLDEWIRWLRERGWKHGTPWASASPAGGPR